jgi:MFS family permease
VVVTQRTAPSSLAPLRHSPFRELFAAQLLSNVGTWMQTVAAQWLMITLEHSALMVALVQTAISLPVVLLALPAGALGDIVDRRRLLIASQVLAVAAAGLLTALTLADKIGAWSLLALTLAVGIGDALRRPAWQALQPQLVPRDQVPQAAALNSANMNVGRAIGPALGGLLVATAGAGWAFGVNAVSYLAVLAVLFAWRNEQERSSLGPERIGAAVRAGARYARSSPRLRAVLVRTALFLTFASALWALLPVAANRQLDLGSGGYGLLLGAVGVGAVAGTALLPRLREWTSLDRVVAGASIAFAAACALIAWVHVVAVVAVALVAVGFAWIAALSSLNATAQSVLPDWVRSRGMALYIIVFQGGQAVGALTWGVVAKQADTRTAFTAVAVGLLAGVVVARRWRLRHPGAIDVRPAQPYGEPDMVIQPDPLHGPVLVQVEYRVPLERAQAFREAMQPVGRARRRSGGERWGLFQDGADPERFVEAYLVPTWEEHMRQHQERTTHTDRLFEERALELIAEGSEPRVEHLLWAYPV